LHAYELSGFLLFETISAKTPNTIVVTKNVTTIDIISIGYSP
jgi:hypothetical protein